MAKVRIGNVEFYSKKKVEEHAKSIVATYPLGASIDSDSDDHQFLLALLDRHPEHAQKVGCGVEYFSRSQHPVYKAKSQGFMLHRYDGTSSDFSYMTCIKGKGPTLIAKFREACRHAVDARVVEHKWKLYDAGDGFANCPETDEPIAKEDCVVRQTEPTWSNLVDMFIAQRGVPVSEHDIMELKDNQYSEKFSSPKLAEEFSNFHEPLMNLVPKKIRRI